MPKMTKPEVGRTKNDKRQEKKRVASMLSIECPSLVLSEHQSQTNLSQQTHAFITCPFCYSMARVIVKQWTVLLDFFA